MVIVMEKRKTKKEIVKMLLKNNSLDEKDEEELLDLLIDQPISIDVDKQEEFLQTAYKFIKDGKIFNELIKGNDTRKQFFEKIIEVQTLLGGDLNDVI